MKSPCQRGARPVACALALVVVWSGEASSHGIVGRRHFVEPIFVEDANPKNELVIGKLRHEEFRAGGNALRYDFALEKKLSERFSLALEGGWSALRAAGLNVEQAGSGFENLGVLLKASVFESAVHEWRLSVGTEIEMPTGSDDVGAEGDPALEPMILWAKGFGDLPAGRVGMMLRPLFAQGDGGLDVAFSDEETEDDAWFADVLIGYSLPYLHRWSPHRLPQPFAGLVPAVELTFEGRIQGQGRTAEAFATPVLFWVGEYFEIGFGARFGINDHAEVEDGALVGIVDLFLDDLVPQANWMPF